MAINEKDAQDAIRKLLSAMDIKSENHTDIDKTPERVIKMLSEVWQGEYYSNADIAKMYDKTFPTDSCQMIALTKIPCFSYCEHHLALIYNLEVSVGYIPCGRVIGLSKIARIADMVCRRLQLQERIGKDILEIMSMIVGDNVIVYIEGEHSCMTSRGIKKAGAKTKTLTYSGYYFNQKENRDEFFDIIQGGD